MHQRRSTTLPYAIGKLSSFVCVIFFLAIAKSGASGTARAQDLDQSLGQAQLVANEEFESDFESTVAPYEFSAAFILERNSNRGSVRVVAKLAPGHHIYSVTPNPSAPAFKTEIRCQSNDVKVMAFAPTTAAKFSDSLPGLEGTPVHWHESEVVWTAAFEIKTPHPSGPDGVIGPIALAVRAQVCSETCIPVDETINATFAGYYDSTPAATTSDSDLSYKRSQVASKAAQASQSFRDTDSMCRWSVELSRFAASPGEEVLLYVTGVPDESFKLYDFAPSQNEVTSETLIVLSNLNDLVVGRIKESNPQPSEFGSDSTIRDEGAKQWTIPLTIPSTHMAGEIIINGWIGYQACSDEQCDQPRGLKFSIPLQISDYVDVAGKIHPSHSSAQISSVSYREVADHPERLTWLRNSNKSESVRPSLSVEQLSATFGLALIGGLLLNFMPCVLPVIGLKILGFITEASGDRRTASRLTLVYSGGIIGVIFAFGITSLAARELTGAAFGWGEHFGWLGFRIVSTAFMFALALSFLGVWDIPIPGFATSQTATKLSRRSGYIGALNKGIITTLLATPCSAPFLGSALVVALTQPAWVVLLIFFGAGLGMALPYLLISLQPKLLDFLPKPGPWMQTFKEFLAFPMLLSVVMFVNGFSGEQKIAMFASLIFLWFGCWFIGRVPAWSTFKVKSRAWAVASLVTVLGSWGAFHWVKPSLHALNWVPYNEPQLQELVQGGRTVLIDFTADWCINCKHNLATAIHTPSVKGMIESSGVVTMEADLTDYPDYIKRKLAELGSVSIPLVAIYPGDNRSPIILRDRISEADVLEALQNAGSGKSAGSATISSLESPGTSSTPMAQTIRRISY